jgi:hypothetical protein
MLSNIVIVQAITGEQLILTRQNEIVVRIQLKSSNEPAEAA